jgi:polysaccharide pyruvyl transferase WcaK-like protein
MSVAFERLAEPILVVGAYGYGNVGDEAILAGLLARLAERRVTVVSRDPEGTRRQHGVEAVGILEAASALRRHASLVIGGGGLFGRDMGAIGRFLPAFGLAASALGRPVHVEGIDLDTRLAPSARLLVPPLMRRAAHVSVRDGQSAEVLRGWGVAADQEPDLSAGMEAAPVKEGRALLRSAGIETRRPVVGLALTGVVSALADQAVEAITEAIDALPEVQFALIPMSRHPRVAGHDDLVLARRLRRIRPRLMVVEELAHPSVVLAAFSQLTAVVAMRYHAMLFAERAHVPLVPLSYAEKTARWLEQRGLEPIPARAPDVIRGLRDAVVRDERAGVLIPMQMPLSMVPARTVQVMTP